MLELHRHGDLHEIRLARPPVNALNFDLLRQLRTVVESAPEQGARGLILSGGPTVFSGGLDVPFLMAQDDVGLRTTWSEFFAAARAIAESPVPVVAAIGGHSPAGGCVLALCCDYRIMASSQNPDKPFRIGLNETQVGLAIPDAIQHLMRRVVGTYAAERLMIAGTMVDEQHARKLGLIDELVDNDALLPRAQQWLSELLALPSAPMLATRKLARADLTHALASFGPAELDGFLAGWHSDDTQAALQALIARLKK